MPVRNRKGLLHEYSSNVFPSFSIKDVVYRRTAEAEHCRKSERVHAIFGIKPPHFKNGHRVGLGEHLLFSARMTAVLNLVRSVFKSRAPAQIANRIVLRVAVKVPTFFAFLAMAYERFKNKVMDVPFASRPDTYFNLEIAL
jgi:hypothetical protein